MKTPPTCARWRALLCAGAVATLAGCAAGPDYVRPEMPAPAAYKELAGWKVAEPRDAHIPARWWEAFGDAQLDALIDQVSVSNQSLAQAEAQYRQALAATRAARAGYFPTVSASASSTRTRSPLGTSSGASVAGGVTTQHELALDASWEIDLWGRVRRQVEASEASAQASAGDLNALRLSTQALVAQNYFQLRTLEAQKRLLDDTVAAYQRSLQLTRNQYSVGVVGKSDVLLAETQLRSTETQALDVSLQRAQLEHAIALALGKAPADFSLAAAPLTLALPGIPAGLPSALLERRPDIAAAERRVAAANAQIGVAKSAYFPTLTLSASGGYRSSRLADWLDAPSRFWSLGPALALALFDGGARRAQTDQAIAAYDASVAGYRQTVLTGFQEVEDSLTAIQILEQEARTQEDAVKSARESLAITPNQYRAGTVSYLNVVQVQATALANERAAVEILGRRLTASVQLVKALGGGWSSESLADLAKVP